MIFKSTHEVFSCPWQHKEDTIMKKTPPKWDKSDPISIEDVVIWEQIYHQPGNIGIYVAWSPNDEFYIVVYDLFANTPAGVKTFKGPTAVEDILALAAKLNIDLPVSRIQV
jgi:hypothetical protein